MGWRRLASSSVTVSTAAARTKTEVHVPAAGTKKTRATMIEPRVQLCMMCVYTCFFVFYQRYPTRQLGYRLYFVIGVDFIK